MQSSIQKKPPFFSIIIPTYNRAPFVSIAIRSILVQEFTDYEIIVVDDGSTDQTREVVEELMDGKTVIKYYFKINEERSIARNYGIERASGTYIGFLDSDDIQYHNHLTVAFELLKQNAFPEVGNLGYEFKDAAGKVLIVRNNFNESFRDELIHENKLHGNAIFIRRDIAEKVNFIPSSLAIVSEDWYVWLRLAARYPFHFNNTVTSAVIQHEGRSLRNINPDKLIASTNIIVEYLKKDIQFLKEYKDKVSYHFANHYTFLALILALTKSRRRETIGYLIKAIRYDPGVVLRKRFLASIKHLF
jgi:glycosyltransferase involved in cell wall biosynthesis